MHKNPVMKTAQIIGIVTQDILHQWKAKGKWQLPWEEIHSCHFLEFRGDTFGLDAGLEELSELKQALKVLSKSKGEKECRLIYTLRLPRDGGSWTRDSHLRENFYAMALEQKLADIVDIELEEAQKFPRLLEGIKKISGGEFIISHHNFDGAYNNQEYRVILNEMAVFKPDIFKFAVSAQNEVELNALLDFSLELAVKNQSSCVISMGEFGPLSRVLSPYLGAAMTYGFFGKNGVVPGQLGILKLRQIFDTISTEPYLKLGRDELKSKIRQLL